MMHARAASIRSMATILVVSAGVLAGCNDDGRTLRPARPDQVGSVSTVAQVTTTMGDPFDSDGLGFDTTTVPAVAAALTAPFVDGEPIDPRHACTGLNVAPALSWTPAPTGAVEIGLTMVDLDFPSFVHWAIAGIDPLSTSLGEGIVPEFAIVGTNGAGRAGYTGPCPPAGETHRYQFTVHFLSQQTELDDGAPGADLQAFLNDSTFSSASVTATYSQG